MESEKPTRTGRGGRNFILGALSGAVAGLIPGFLLWTMTGQWFWLVAGSLGLALFGAVVALLLRPFGT